MLCGILLHQKMILCSDIYTFASRLHSRFTPSHYCAINATSNWSSEVATFTNLIDLCPYMKVDMIPSEMDYMSWSADVYLLTLMPTRLVAGIFKPVHYCTAPHSSSVGLLHTEHTHTLPHTKAPTYLRQLQRLRTEKSNLWANGVYCSLVKLPVFEHNM